MESQIFHHAKIQSSQKNPLKETKNPSRYHKSASNLKFQYKLKISFVKKPSYKK
jgi:hypothetical protein